MNAENNMFGMTCRGMLSYTIEFTHAPIMGYTNNAAITRFSHMYDRIRNIVKIECTYTHVYNYVSYASTKYLDIDMLVVPCPTMS